MFQQPYGFDDMPPPEEDFEAGWYTSNNNINLILVFAQVSIQIYTTLTSNINNRTCQMLRFGYLIISAAATTEAEEEVCTSLLAKLMTHQMLRPSPSQILATLQQRAESEAFPTIVLVPTGT